MPTSPTHRQPKPTPGGVLTPPAGLSRPAAWVISAVVVVIGATILFAARESLSTGSGLLVGGNEGSVASGSPPDLDEISPAVATEPAPKVVEPKAPAWSLVQVGDAVHGAIPKLQTLIDEGRGEIPNFKAMGSKRAERAERAKRQWGAWGQIWKNRVGVVEATLPPPEACAVHAAMEPACQAIREATRTLASVPDEPNLDAARERFETTEQILDLLLNPPEPELPPEEEGEDSEAEVNAEEDAV